MRQFINMILIALISAISGQSYAQGLGLQLPELKLETWKDGKKEIIQTKDLKGKLVVLDFWNITCSACISAMPKMDSLQEEFGDRIKMLLVTKNTKEEADKLFNRIGTKARKAAFVYGDSILNAMFPHQGEPFHVWIDTLGKAIFQTAGYNTNRKTISSYLSRDTKFTLPHEAGFSTFELKNSLVELINTTDYIGIRGYSIFSRNITNISTINYGRVFEKDSLTGNIHKIKLFNVSISDLIRYAFNSSLKNVPVGILGENYRIPVNRIIYEGKDPAFFTMPKQDELKADWIEMHTFCYEIYNPSDGNIFTAMPYDLDRYTDYNIKIEQRQMNCLVLVQSANGDKGKFKGTAGNGALEIVYGRDDITFKNASVFDLLALLSQANSRLSTPFIDGTGYKGKLNIVFGKGLSDLDKLREDLKIYNLDLVEEKRTIDMVIVNDKKGSGI